MIFITAGTQLKFDRLAAIAQELANQVNNEVICQIKDIKINHQNIKYYELLPIEEFDKNLKTCEVLICHAGMGTIIKALKHNKKIIVVPRRYDLGEHRNNHQMEIVPYLRQKINICIAHNTSDVLAALQNRDARISPTHRNPARSMEIFEYIQHEINVSSET